MNLLLDGGSVGGILEVEAQHTQENELFEIAEHGQLGVNHIVGDITTAIYSSAPCGSSLGTDYFVADGSTVRFRKCATVL